MKRVKDFLVGFILVNLFWLVLSLILDIRVLPTPFRVYGNFSEVVKSGIFIHIAASLGRIAVGLLFSVIIGLPIGLLMARSGIWNRLLHPLVYFSYPIPKTALLPVAMLLLGLGNGSKILIMVLTMVFQIILSVRDSVKRIPEEFYQVGKSAGFSKRYIFCNITFPAILPDLFTAFRISIGTALAILLIVEAYGTKVGIGYYILDAWSRINYLQMYGGIVVIALTGAILILLVDVLAEKICPWK